MEYIIYKSLNKINNKAYIGQTCKSLNERKRGHFCDARTNRYNIPFHNAIRKYGEDSFTWEVLEAGISKEDIDDREIYFIKNNLTIHPDGYNLQSGGCKLKKHHKESIEKMRNYHKNRPVEVRMKISIANKGRKHSESWKTNTINGKKQAAKNRGYWHSEEMKEKNRIKHTGKKLTDDHKRKLSESHKGYIHTESQKKKMSESIIKKGIFSRNKSGFKGVGFMKSKNKWRARLGDSHLGLFDTPEDAAKAYDLAAIEKYGIGNCTTNHSLGLVDNLYVEKNKYKVKAKSGFKGVYKDKRGKWYVAFCGKFYGYEKTAEDAAKLYDRKVIEKYGEFGFSKTNKSLGLL